MQQASASLLSDQAMGGIWGEKGFKYQDAYIVSKIPDLLCDSGFIQILKEGSGDVDFKYTKNNSTFRVYTQIKDHSVTPSEFKSVLSQFKGKDVASPGTYQQYTLACTGLSEDIKTLKSSLDRIRDTKNFYSADDQLKIDSILDLKGILKGLSIEADLDFVYKKVFFDTGLPELVQMEALIRLFCGGMQTVEDYKDKAKYSRQIFFPLYAFIVDSSGKSLDRKEVEEKIEEFFETYKLKMEEDGFTLRVYHWEDAPYELKLEYDEVLDWSNHFDRKTRKIATLDIWQNELLPQLVELQKKIRASSTNRLIKIDGSSCLSAGIAIGSAFPEVAGYTIEFQARLGPKIETWRNDIIPSTSYILKSQLSKIQFDGDGLAVKFNIVADTSSDFDKYVSDSGNKFNAVLDLFPQNGIGEFVNKESVISYARNAKGLIRDAITKCKTNKVHLFFAGPLGLAIFFGQQLNSMPEVQCYEQKIDGGYQVSCLIPKT